VAPAETSAPPAAIETPPPPAATAAPQDAPTTAPSTTASLRARLESLEARVESAAASAAGRLGELARQEASGEHARDLVQALTGLLPALRERLGAVAALRTLVAGSGRRDAFGMDGELVERAFPVLDFLYRSWWRVDARRIERVPSEGPVVIVANHGGALPWDALVLRMALLRDHPARRELRPLLDRDALATPLVGTAALRLGAVPATPDNALALLAEGGAVAAFPEGSRNALRPWPMRYRVDRFGRGGFARLALRTGAIVVPCAIVGSEETSAPFARAGWLAERLGMPFLTSTPTQLLAPLGLLPLPSRWSLRFGEPIDTREAGVAAADDPTRVLEFTERTRASLQHMLDEDVAARRSVYL
jgi:1-acyl-sn-glycerol-3-phosphate acyltransferase